MQVPLGWWTIQFSSSIFAFNTNRKNGLMHSLLGLPYLSIELHPTETPDIVWFEWHILIPHPMWRVHQYLSMHWSSLQEWYDMKVFVWMRIRRELQRNTKQLAEEMTIKMKTLQSHLRSLPKEEQVSRRPYPRPVIMFQNKGLGTIAGKR